MKETLTITYRTYDHKGRDKYSTSRAVDIGQGLREIALSVINEAIGKTKYNWLSETHEDQPIIFFLQDSGHDIYQEFGIRYGINKDGTLRFLSDFAPLHYNWSLAEIKELQEDGYIKGDTSHIVIATPQGLGASGGLMPQVFEALIYIGGIHGGVQALKSPMIAIHSWAVARRWNKNGLKSLNQIRKLLDEKSVWKTGEVKKRLGVNEEFVNKILTKLGYELSGNAWKLGQSSDALELRNQWLAKETEIEDTRQAQLEKEIMESEV